MMDMYVSFAQNLLILRMTSDKNMSDEEWIFYNNLLRFSSTLIARAQRQIDEQDTDKECP